MEFNDILGLGKILPLDKLTDVISKGVGRLTKSYFDKVDVKNKEHEIKRLAEARAYEIAIITKSFKESGILSQGIKYENDIISFQKTNNIPIEQRSSDRIGFQDAIDQLNIECITSYAAQEVKNELPITDTPVSQDWITRFFDYAKDISNEEMQILWGKILAGEVKCPKSFSLRTLDIIRNLSQEEANIFAQVANFAIKCNQDSFIYKGKHTIDKGFEIHQKYQLDFANILDLVDVGLMQVGDFVSFGIDKKPDTYDTLLISGPYSIYLTKQANENATSIPIYPFTKSGSELLSLIKPITNIDYLNDFANGLNVYNNRIKYSVISSESKSSSSPNSLMDFPIIKPL